MRNQATIELIGYVAGEPEHPKVDQYPNLIKFSMGVTRRWKNKSGEEKEETQWFKCSSWSEGLTKIIKQHVKVGMGLLVRGNPKTDAYIKDGVAKAQIEVNLTEINMLTFPNDSENHNTNSTVPNRDMQDDEIPF